MEAVIFYYMGVGFVAGMVGSMLGLGGGIIIVPALTILLDVNVKSAIAASLISLVATSVMAVSVYARQGLVNYKLGMVFETMTIVGSFVGSWTAIYIDEKWLLFFFCLLLVGAGGTMLHQAWDGPRPAMRGSAISSGRSRWIGQYVDAGGQSVSYEVRHAMPGTLLSIVAGWISGLLGVGGGIVKVPIMTSICGLPVRVATATSSFMIGFTGLAGALVYFMYGHVDVSMTSALAIGVVTGSMTGSRQALRMSSKYLTLIFVLVLAVTAVRLMIKAWNMP